MTKVYNPRLETQLKRTNAPFTTPRLSTPTIKVNHQQYHYTIHNNGTRYPSPIPRKRKVLVYARQGLVPARRFFYHLHHPRWDGQGIIIHLDGDDLNFHKSNLVLLTTREAKSLVHFNNNNLVYNNPELQSMVIDQIRAGIALRDLNYSISKKGGDQCE